MGIQWCQIGSGVVLFAVNLVIVWRRGVPRAAIADTHTHTQTYFALTAAVAFSVLAPEEKNRENTDVFARLLHSK